MRADSSALILRLVWQSHRGSLPLWQVAARCQAKRFFRQPNQMEMVLASGTGPMPMTKIYWSVGMVSAKTSPNPFCPPGAMWPRMSNVVITLDVLDGGKP